MKCQLLSYLAKLKQESFTGKLSIGEIVGYKFQIYFYLGRLLWADGGFHPNRAWQRHLDKYFPQLDFHSLSLPALERFEYWKYYLLTILYEENLCDKEKFVELINSRLIEVVFDIFFAEREQKLDYQVETISHSILNEIGFKHTITLLNIEQILQIADRDWRSWQDNQFQDWHPDLVPLIIDSDRLEESIYLNFSKKKIKETIGYIDGKNSLRDIASLGNMYLLELMYSLVPYIRGNSIELIDTPDLLPLSTSTGSLLSNLFSGIQYHSPELSNFKGHDYQPIVVCLDNDLQTLTAIETVVYKCEYKFLRIQDPLQAVNIIFEYQPDLFFINSKFSEFDGYSFAIKLRKIAQFKKTPIFLLSENKCREDRLKAKVIGIDEIIEKPVKITKILRIIQKSLSVYEKFYSSNTYASEEHKMEELIALIAKNL